jgi:hypothetical protein
MTFVAGSGWRLVDTEKRHQGGARHDETATEPKDGKFAAAGALVGGRPGNTEQCGGLVDGERELSLELLRPGLGHGVLLEV